MSRSLMRERRALRLTVCAALAAGSFAAANPADAQAVAAAPVASDAPRSDLDTVTVEARRQRALLEAQISTYVSSITMPNREEALQKWQTPICPAIVGLSREQADFVLAQISRAARDAGAPLAPRDCAANFLVLAAKEPESVLEAWWSKNPRMFNDSHGVGGIKHFLGGSQPIRAWYNSLLGCDGGAARVENGRFFFPEHCAGGLGSKLSREVIRVIFSVIVIVDLKKVSGLNIQQLADYVAFVGLAQIRENAQPGDAATILHLFDPGAARRPQGLSQWDQLFLKSLYSTNQSDLGQVSEIKVLLDRELVH